MSRCNYLALALVIGGMAGTAQAADTVKDAFRAPPKSARLALRWWWPGGDVSDVGLATQLKAFDDVHIGALEIQPFRSGLGDVTGDRLARVEDYATPAFFAHVAAAAKTAQGLGLDLDYTLGSGWPSGGGASITPELAQTELRMATVRVTGPLRFDGPLPQIDRDHHGLDFLAPPLSDQTLSDDWKQRLAAREKPVAVIAVRAPSPQIKMIAVPGPFPIPPSFDVTDPADVTDTIDISDMVAADGTLHWDVPVGDWQIITFKTFAANATVGLSVGSGPQLVLDHFNKAAFTAHADRVFDAGLPELSPYLGKGLNSLFVDSFELNVWNYWTDDFLAQFQRLRGYDLKPYLPLILQPGWMNPYMTASALPEYREGDIGERVLADYHRTISDLMQAEFFTPLRDEAHSHGVKLRLQAHGAPADLVSTYGFADIPETEDLHVGPQPDFLAVARSAADIYGAGEVSSESLIMLGHTLDATPSLWKTRTDKLFASGVNHVIGHGAAYNPDNAAFNTWFPFGTFVGSDFNAGNPLFNQLTPFSDYVARAQAVLQATQNVIPVALYQDSLIVPADLHRESRTESATSLALRTAGFNQDWLTADGLLKSAAKDGKLSTLGGTAFDAIIVNDQATLRPETAEKLADLARTGVPVLFLGQVPSRGEGVMDRGTGDDRVRAAVAAIGGGSVMLDGLPAALQAKDVLPRLHFSGAAVPDFLEKSDGRRQIVFVANPDDAAHDYQMKTVVVGGVELWHTATGGVSPWGGETDVIGEVIPLHLLGHQSLFVAVDPAKPLTAPPAPARLLRDSKILGKTWRLTGDGIDQTHKPVQVSLSLAKLSDWRQIPKLAHFSGTVSYSQSLDLTKQTGARYVLDLGEVHDVAQVTVNGCSVKAGFAPFLVDITAAVRRSHNSVTIAITNSPQNSLEGYAPDTMGAFSGNDPAGLMGPLHLKLYDKQQADITSLTCDTTGR